MAKSKALADAEIALQAAAEAACSELGLDHGASVTLFGTGLMATRQTFQAKVLLLAALPADSPISTMLRRHLIEFMPNLPDAPDRREARHEGRNPAKASRRKVAPDV
jgi:hypothetical protein